MPGTDFALHYESDRTPGRAAANSLPIRLSDASIPGSVDKIKLEVYVAGRQFKSEFDNEKNLTHTFLWDGKDKFGRQLEGAQTAHIRVGYSYPDQYADGVTFSEVSSQSPDNAIDTRVADAGDG